MLLQQLSSWLITQKLLPVRVHWGVFSVHLQNCTTAGAEELFKKEASGFFSVVFGRIYSLRLSAGSRRRHHSLSKLENDIGFVQTTDGAKQKTRPETVSVCLISSQTFHAPDNSYELLFCSCTVITELKGTMVQSIDICSLLCQVRFRVVSS